MSLFGSSSYSEKEARKENLIIQYIDPNPRSNGDSWSLCCPRCGQRRAYIYKNSWTMQCNRINECGWVDNLWDYAEKTIPASFYKETDEETKKRREQELRKEQRQKDYAKLTLTPALGVRSLEVSDFLKCRLPGADLDFLFEEKYIGVSWAIEKNNGVGAWLSRKKYLLMSPLYNINTNEIVSAQCRFSIYGADPTIVVKPKTDNPKPEEIKRLKIWSLKGYKYGRGGATFGRLDFAIQSALATAKKNNSRPKIVVFEGDIDYLTGLAAGFRNCVGVPGAGQAINVAQYIQRHYDTFDIVMSLDGDNAGEASFLEVTKHITKMDIRLFNGRPILNFIDRLRIKDINDIWRHWGGAESVRRVVRQARLFVPEKEMKKIKYHDPFLKDIRKRDLYIEPIHLSAMAKDRYLCEIRNTGGRNSPIAHLARAVLCGETKECELHYDTDDNAHLGTTKSRVAENPVCSHCAAMQWNLSILPHILEKWPEKLLWATIPFEKGNLKAALDKRKEICRLTRFKDSYTYKSMGEDNGKSLFIIIDCLQSHLLVISGATDNPIDIAVSTLRSFTDLKLIDRDKLLGDQLAGAYMSYSYYISDVGSDFASIANKDPFIITKFQRYTQRKNLCFPKQKEIKETVRKRLVEIVEAREKAFAEEAEKTPDSYKILSPTENPDIQVKHTLKVTFRERTTRDMSVRGIRRILGISKESLNFGNLVKADLYNEKMKFNPDNSDSWNMLMYPKLCPYEIEKVVQDFYWLIYNKPAYVNGKEMAPIPFIDREPPKKKYRQPDDLMDELREWSALGYCYRKYTFRPGEEVSLDDFRHMLDNVKRGIPFPEKWLRKEPYESPSLKRLEERARREAEEESG